MTTTEPGAAAEPGAVLSRRYHLEAEIGRGGAGRVFRAHDARLDRPVAVKVLTDLGEDAVARFRREAATAARIQHPNVVTLHDAGVDGAPYLVMSLVAGPSLADRVGRHGPLDTAALHRLAADLFAGLDATHGAGVLHRDLTPRNVLFDDDGAALLADFGIARGPDDPTITAEHTIMGTRPFVAPERLRGAPATVAADLFAVGVTLRHAATSSHDTPLPDDHPLAPLVLACTDPDPGRRPGSAAAAARRVEAVTAPPSAVPPTRELPPVTPQPAATPTAPDDPPVRNAPAPRDAPTTGHPSDERLGLVASRPRVARPLLVVALLLVLALAAALGSAAVRTTTPDPAAGRDDAPAPTFDPQAPEESARRLAEWLRQRG